MIVCILQALSRSVSEYKTWLSNNPGQAASPQQNISGPFNVVRADKDQILKHLATQQQAGEQRRNQKLGRKG